MRVVDHVAVAVVLLALMSAGLVSCNDLVLGRVAQADQPRLSDLCKQPVASPNTELTQRLIERIGDLRRNAGLAPIEVLPTLTVHAQIITCQRANSLNRWTADPDQWVESSARYPAFVDSDTCYMGAWVFTYRHEDMTILTGQALYLGCSEAI